MPRLLLTFLLCWLAMPVLAQQHLARARQSSYLTKVFQLTESQTRRLYERGLQAAQPDFFTAPVDSFPTDKPVTRPLPPGYYLVAHTEGPELVYWLRAETDRCVEVLDNQVDLVLVVRDTLGHLLPDARVAVRGRAVPYDVATQTYRRPHGGRAGLVAVTAGGRTTYHALRQVQHYSWLKQAGQRVLYGKPLGYATRPVWRLGRDLKHASRVETGLVGMLRSAFSEGVRDNRRSRSNQESRGSQQWTGFLVTSQPRYRPGDTLRLKARVLRRRNGHPCTRPLTLWLSNDNLSHRLSSGDLNTEKRLATLRPVRPGSYEYALVLADTLGLGLGAYTQLLLKDQHENLLVSESFRYEDYELKNAHYALRPLTREPRRGETQAVFARGYDASDLNLFDARVQLAVVPSGQPGPLPTRRLFLPDTLWTHTQALDALGETRIELPAGIFPDVDFSYTVRATFLTSDNERRSETLLIPYERDPGRLRLAFRHDSVQLRYDSLGRSVPHRARLSVRRDEDHYWLTNQAVQLPLSLPLNPLARNYELRDEAGHLETLALSRDNAGLSLQAERTADSVRLAVLNPRQLPFWYYVYQGNRLRYRGYGTRYAAAVADRSPAAWHVSLHYYWGTGLRTADYTASLPRPQLAVASNQPAAAYPGQHLRLRFSVSDERDRPVPNADLTAYAYTSKFEAGSPPDGPTFYRPVPARQARRRFQLRRQFANHTDSTRQQQLDWRRWQHQLGLDSLQFYRFLYPASGRFAEYRPAPGGLAQVAPFVVDSGRVQVPIAFYVDGQPAYIHALNEHEHYTAVADTGYHTLRIRTATRLVELRRVYVRPLHKLTFSIDVNHPAPDLTVTKMSTELSKTELLALRRTVLAVESDEPATVRQGRVLRPLGNFQFPQYQRYHQLTFSGPFRPDSILYRPLAGGRTKFLFEPQYAYQFRPGLLQMKQLELQQLGSFADGHFVVPLPLDDFAYTESDLRTQLPARYVQRWHSPTPSSTPTGRGRLQVRLPPGTPGQPVSLRRWPLYTLLTRPDQPAFARLEHGLGVLHDLAPGRYQVAVLLADTSSLAPQELVLVEANGQTFFQLQPGDQQAGRALSGRIVKLLRAQDSTAAAAAQAEARRDIRLEQPPLPGPDWSTLRGRVIEHGSEEGLPSVTVLVRGMPIGISTDVNGEFTLRVPPGPQNLLFSSVGYVTQQVLVQYNVPIQVALKPDNSGLGEVVVVGSSGLRQAPQMGYATRTINTISGLSSQVNGVLIQTLPGGANPKVRVMLRGNRSLTGDNQALVIIDGLPATTEQLAALNPDDIATQTVLKGTTATALYGTQAANGALIITTRQRARTPGQMPGLADLPAPGDPRLSLRRRFFDHAWWRPTLVTDAQGLAQTDVVLPDDVTSWDTFVLGSDGHGRVGSTTGKLRAFKALRAELAVPRFLLAGDQVQVLGKALNYQPDSAQVSTRFEVGGRVLRPLTRSVKSSVIDTLTLMAASGAGAPDSVTVTYGLTQASGYADGEQRSLPVLPVGTRERVGTFATVLAADTTVQLPLVPGLGEATVRIEADALPVLLAEIQHLQAYPYLCNEQVASRLLGLLLAQRIRTARGEKFTEEKAVNALIRKLQEGRHQPEGLWGTWPKAEVSAWATVHAVEALLAARQVGYKADFEQDKVQTYLLRELDDSFDHPATLPGYFRTADDQVRLLRLLHTLGAPADYATYLRRLEQAPRPALGRYLALLALRQELKLPYQLDSLRRYRGCTALGGAFYADTLHAGTYFRYLLPDRVGTTLLAYQLLRAQGGHAAELARIRSFLLGLRGGGYWASTYQSAQILSVIGPDLLAAGGASAQVQFSGAPAGLPTGVITKFPFEASIPATGVLTLHKTGGLPVYTTAYQTRWNAAPEAVARPFTVTTTLAGQGGRQVALPAGRPAELLVTVDVKAEAHYVLLEVPIPAGCSYGDPAPTSPGEVHREYLKQQVGIFLDELAVGRHTFRVTLQPRYRGTYTLNPARAELLYFPTTFGRTGSKRVAVH